MPIILQMFVPVYRWRNPGGVGTHTAIGSQTFETEYAARRKPKGPFVPHEIEVIDVVPVRFTVVE